MGGKKLIIVRAVLGLVVGLFLIALTRTAFLNAPEDPVPCIGVSSQCAYLNDSQRNFSGRLAEALTFPTVSTGPGDYDRDALLRFRQFLEKSFPRVRQSPRVRWEVVSNYSLLLTVKGSDPALKPYMLCAHMDVVPVNMDRWHLPPFAGAIHMGDIWGRGAIDAKHILMGVLEALEWIVEQDVELKRTLYIAFGHDEEVGGMDGAAAIGRLLESRGVQLEFLLDEGMLIMLKVLPGMDTPFALIGVTEKGSLLSKVTARGTSTHTSMPPRETAIVTLSKALVRFHGQSQPVMFGKDVVASMFEAMALSAPFLYKLAFANIWLFHPLISWVMSHSVQMDSLIRTTTSVTRVQGGIKDNVVPSEAHAFINQRIHPSQTVQEVSAYNRALVSHLPNVTVEAVESMEPHRVSPHGATDFGYQIISRTARQIFPQASVAPAMLVANTDVRHYLRLTGNIYRFSPVCVTPQEVSSRLHGDNERISLWNYERVVNFYLRLMMNADSRDLFERAPRGRKSGEL